jgi:hypothetical protein
MNARRLKHKVFIATKRHKNIKPIAQAWPKGFLMFSLWLFVLFVAIDALESVCSSFAAAVFIGSSCDE